MRNLSTTNFCANGVTSDSGTTKSCRTCGLVGCNLRLGEGTTVLQRWDPGHEIHMREIDGHGVQIESTQKDPAVNAMGSLT